MGKLDLTDLSNEEALALGRSCKKLLEEYGALLEWLANRWSLQLAVTMAETAANAEATLPGLVSVAGQRRGLSMFVDSLKLVVEMVENYETEAAEKEEAQQS